MLRFILQDNSAVIQTMSRGVLEVRANLKGFSVHDQLVVDRVLNRFYLARIGLRFLIEHHILSHSSDGHNFAGIIESRCEPAKYLKFATEDASKLCENYCLLPPPKVELEQVTRNQSRDTIAFTYVPSHLHCKFKLPYLYHA
mmetsp:Transcript_16150/g.29516  ORF Transcript_16150/g.29516 Transcript_16150/m.29516 type:complete len:142 (+) Transcript_16150:66-491(+)